MDYPSFVVVVVVVIIIIIIITTDENVKTSRRLMSKSIERVRKDVSALLYFFPDLGHPLSIFRLADFCEKNSILA
jgi:hypothetical protein